MRVERSELLSQYSWLTHGFCSPGPASPQPFEENCSFQQGPPEQVLAARRRACEDLGVAPHALTFVYQEHGAKIRSVSLQDRGAGATPGRERLGPADGLYTQEPELPLGILVADCLPVFFVDLHRRRIGLVHSGWRGTYGNIAGAMAQRWIEEGGRAEDIAIWIGPGIGPESFQAGSEVLEEFAARYPDWQDLLFWDRDRSACKPGEPGAGRVDLKSFVRRQLLVCGVSEERIEMSPACTLAGEGYFSYRRDGPGKGHNMAVIAKRNGRLSEQVSGTV